MLCCVLPLKAWRFIRQSLHCLPSSRRCYLLVTLVTWAARPVILRNRRELIYRRGHNSVSVSYVFTCGSDVSITTSAFKKQPWDCLNIWQYTKRVCFSYSYYNHHRQFNIPFHQLNACRITVKSLLWSLTRTNEKWVETQRKKLTKIIHLPFCWLRLWQSKYPDMIQYKEKCIL